MASAFLTAKRSEVADRMKKIRPQYEEYQELERVLAALEGVEGPKRGPGRPPGSRNRRPRARPAGAKRRRRRAGGTRGEQVVKLVQQNPGITVPELAKRLGMSRPNYLYKVMGELASDGRVRKDGKGFQPVA